MKKLFISQPMKGKTDEEILKERENAIRSAEKPSADVAYFAKGWNEARGCKIEHTCAVEYGILTIEDYRKE